LKNPYIVDRPLTDQDLPFGREASLARLARYLNTDHRLILLYGKRYAGKTSFINHLGARTSARYVVHRLELPLSAAETSDPFWLTIQVIARTLNRAEPDQRLYAAQGQPYLAGYLSSLVPEADIVHLICMDALPISALGSETRWPEALAALYTLLRQSQGLALLVAIEGLPGEVEPKSGLIEVPHIDLEPLREDETESVLAGPVRGVLSFDYEVIRRIHRLSGGNPFFVQLFGHILFDRRIEAGWVSLPDVDQALDQVIAFGAPQFESTWENASPGSRIVLCAFAAIVGHYGISTARDVASYLANQGIQMPLADVEQALSELATQQVLDKLGGETFRFGSELLRYWLKRNKNITEAVRRARTYRQRRPQQARAPGKRIDWTGIVLWVVAAVLALLIAMIWRSRHKGIIWTVEPTPFPEAAAPSEATPTAIPPTPETALATGYIVYVAKAKPEDNWQIYKMRSDGSDPVRVTNTQDNETSPVWSPDGRRILFVSDRNGNRDIYVMNADGNEQLNLSNHPSEDWTPSWSPDGKRIAFATFRDGNWEIYSVDPQGAKPQRLTQHKAADYNPVWSPDGRRIAFISNRDGNLEIYLMNADGSDQHRLTQDKATDQAPVWSPDSSKVLWESYRDGNMEIYVVNADGSNLQNLSQDTYADDHGPTWSPDGRYIAFFSNRDQGWDIYTLNLETGERTNLTNSPELEQWPQWGTAPR
jgi:Tol biopolymer transport system component